MGRVPRAQVRTDASWQAIDILNFFIAFLFIAALILLWPGQFDLGQQTAAPVANDTVTEPLPATEQTAMLSAEQAVEEPVQQTGADSVAGDETRPDSQGGPAAQVESETTVPETETSQQAAAPVVEQAEPKPAPEIQAPEVVPQQQAEVTTAAPTRPESSEPIVNREQDSAPVPTTPRAAATSVAAVEPTEPASPETQATDAQVSDLAPVEAEAEAQQLTAAPPVIEQAEPKPAPEIQAPEVVPLQQAEVATAAPTRPEPSEPIVNREQDAAPVPTAPPAAATSVAAVEPTERASPETQANDAQVSDPAPVAIVKSDTESYTGPMPRREAESKPAAPAPPTEAESTAEPPQPLVLADARASTQSRSNPNGSFDCSVLNRGINLAVSSGRAEFNQQAKTQLRSIARCIRLLSGRYEIGGHTDYLGDPLENLLLSVERAQAAADALISMGVQQSQLAIKGFGQTQPVADNYTAKGRARNRRITVVRRNG